MIFLEKYTLSKEKLLFVQDKALILNELIISFQVV